MIDIQKMRRDSDNALNSAPNDAGFAYACELKNMLNQALNELESLREPSVASDRVLREEIARMRVAAGCPAELMLTECPGWIADRIVELEALRKPERPDLVAWREELARIDAAWCDMTRPYGVTFDALRVAHVRALDALAAGWPDVEEPADVVERGAIAAYCAADDLGSPEKWRALVPTEGARYRFHDIARAVLRSAGRLPEPVAITDEVVEEATIRAWCAVTYHGHIGTKGTFDVLPDCEKIDRRNEARAVLEYAASRGVAPASPVSRRYFRAVAQQMPVLVACAAAQMTEAETIVKLAEHTSILAGELHRIVEQSHVMPDVDTGAAERVTQYRCFVTNFSPDENPVIDSLHFGVVPRAGDTVHTPDRGDFNVLHVAHYPGNRAESATFSIMLAAERTPDAR